MKNQKGQAAIVVAIIALIFIVGLVLALASFGVHNCAVNLRELLQPWRNFCQMPIIPLPLGQ